MIYLKSARKLVTTALHEKPFKALISLHLKLQKWSFISLASTKNAENDIFISSNPNVSTVSVPSLAYHLWIGIKVSWNDLEKMSNQI